MQSATKKWLWLALGIVVACLACGFAAFREAGHAEWSYGQQAALRAGIVAFALGAWFLTQSLLGGRALVDGPSADGVHRLTARLNAYFHANPRAASALLIVSSFGIDVFGVALIAASVFGHTMRPIIGLVIVFALRQICQAFCALPAPEGMIWRRPGLPSLLVTYDVANDFFFSGHTSIAILGAIEATRLAPAPVAAAAWCVAVFELCTVLVLRAHYTMDVFTGIVTAACAAQLAEWLTIVA